MRARSRRRVAAVLLLAAAAWGGAAAGCSLGLDASLIGQEAGSDAPGGDDVSADGPATPPGDGPVDGATDAAPTIDAGACSVDKDCQSAAAGAGGCVTSAKCDPVWHVCMLDVCHPAACKAEVCNLTTGTCTVPNPYGFATTQFTVQYGGVGAGLRNSIAAVWPFVFVITTNGVVAYDVVDPSSSTPNVVPVHGMPFIPMGVLAVGRRVYFMSNTQGGGPTYRQAIAWVDVPQNPFQPGFMATTAWVGSTEHGVASVLTDGINGFFEVYSSGNLSPTTNAAPPLDDTTKLQAFSNAGLASGASIVASSGSRLVSYRYDGAPQLPNFALVNKAATSGAQTTSEQTLGAYDGGSSPGNQLANQAAFATGDDGTLLWTSAVYDVLDSGSNDGIASARLTWLLASGTAANFDNTVHVDLETYSPATGATVVGPPVWIDVNTALGLAAASSTSTSSTSVQAVVRSPAAVVPGKRTLLSVDPGSVGAAASGGFGYVLAQDDPKNNTASVYIFAPSCGGADQ